MKHRAVLCLALAAGASGSIGCQRVLDAVRGLTGNSGAPGEGSASQPAGANGQPAAGSVRTPAPSRAGGCPALVANAALPPGTVHNNTVERDEVWSLEDSPHRLPDGLTVRDGATLTVAPCAVVLVGRGNGVEVQDGGGLVASGDGAHPIRFGSDNPQPQAGDWLSLWLASNVRRASRLSHVVVEHAGNDWNGRWACIGVLATGLHVDHVTARQCRGYGVGLFDNGTFSLDSSALTVTETAAGNAPLTGAVFVQRAPSVGSLPRGAYTGNATDEVYIAEGSAGSDSATVRQSAVWKNLSVPYHIADDVDVRVEGPTGPVLTIAAGTTLRFGRGAGLSAGFDAEGGLVLDGNAEATRIVLRPAGTDESPAQWHGVYLGPRTNRSATRLRYVTVRNAGQGWNGQLCDWEGASSDNAFVMLEVQPNPGSIEHVTFAGGAPDVAAFGRRWNGPAFDFNAPALGHDFAALGAACHQSPQPDANGACPDPAPRCD